MSSRPSRPAPVEAFTPVEPARRSAPAPGPSLAVTAGLAVRIAGALTAAVLVLAIVVQLAAGGWARRRLAFHFARVPARPGVAATAFLHNLHALMAIGGALLVAQSPYLAQRAERAGRVHRWLQGACEMALTAGVAANVVVIGASFGAYGLRMVRAALPHGPIELAAYALALALYLEARGRRLPIGHGLAVAVLSASALAVAAVLETYVNV